MIEELRAWDFPDTELVPDGYDLSDRPTATSRNLEFMMDKYNEMVRLVNKLTERCGLVEGET